MKYAEISNKSVTELQKDLAELRQKANGLMIKNRLAQVKNTHQLRAIRKDIARVLTALKFNSSK